MKTYMKTLFATLVVVMVLPAVMFGQAVTTQTTLSSAILAVGNQAAGVSSTQNIIFVASTTGFTASSQTQEYDLYIDGEMMKVQAVNTTSGGVTVTRAIRGTAGVAHASGAIVYFGIAGQLGPFVTQDPIAGTICTATQYATLPIINVQSVGGTKSGSATGRIWNCIGSEWMRDDGYILIEDCEVTVSGNATGTNGHTIVGTVPVPVNQAATSATGTNTHTYSCDMSAAASRLNLRGIMLRDVVFPYGVQTASLGTQVATLASGTFNSTIVFTKIAYPAPGASETASSNAARADSGTLTITPAVASFNVATTTAGQFYTAKFTPATPFLLSTDLAQYLANFTFTLTATTATTTNSPGLIMHYAYLPD